MIKENPSVLVVSVYTHHKKYCKDLFLKVFNSLTYFNKLAAFISEDDCPQLRDLPTGEMRAAAGRQLGIEEAKRRDVDFILFLDLDIEPDVDVIEKMLAVDHGLVGGMCCARGNPYFFIGHNYANRKNFARIFLKDKDLSGNPYLDCVGGGMLLVARGIYNRVDYLDYLENPLLNGKFIGDDEYLQLKIYNSLKIRPKLCSDAFSWHYHDDGVAYKLFGLVKIWKNQYFKKN